MVRFLPVRAPRTTSGAGHPQQRTDTSGALIEVTRDAAGNSVNRRELQQATGTGGQ